ncbi:MAG: hypothetical protein K6T29_02660 [Peptococcaceae bacterium]|nr:hypothetical protein [Peptococcaceae bacterium]
MDGLPDVTGFPLDEAVQRCKEMGYDVEILVARPVGTAAAGKPRAVRFKRLSKDKGVLTVVCEDAGRGGGESGIQDY